MTISLPPSPFIRLLTNKLMTTQVLAVARLAAAK